MNDDQKGKEFLKLIDEQNTLQWNIVAKLSSLIKVKLHTPFSEPYNCFCSTTFESARLFIFKFLISSVFFLSNEKFSSLGS